jgi:N-acetylmuramoyl-L-alanine amidase
MVFLIAHALISLFLLFEDAASGASSDAVVSGLRHWSSPNCTRIVLDLSQEVPFKEFVSDQGSVVEIEFPGVIGRGTPESLKVKDGTVEEVRLKASQRGWIRLWLKKSSSKLKHTAFMLPRVNGRPVRLMIDVENPQGRGKEAQMEVLSRKGESHSRRAENLRPGPSQGVKVIVIDPGHGGEDPGAIGATGVKEKDVVLTISQKLQRELESTGKFRAVLTRKGDYFIPLRDRVRVAHEYKADLFISIHADSSPRRETRGASVYCLSLSGATDEAARILAEKENASDLIGGVRLTDDHDVNTILVDLLQTQTINDSLRLGSVLLDSLGRVHQVKFSNPKQAGFRVLKAPDIPSVLVEVGFLSNPQEERLLSNGSFQASLVKALTCGVASFLGVDLSQGPVLTRSSSEGNWPSWRRGPSHTRGGEEKVKEHVVEPGQTLSHIASIYGRRVEDLQAANGIKDPSRLRPGQRIVVP